MTEIAGRNDKGLTPSSCSRTSAPSGFNLALLVLLVFVAVIVASIPLAVCPECKVDRAISSGLPRSSGAVSCSLCKSKGKISLWVYVRNQLSP